MMRATLSDEVSAYLAMMEPESAPVTAPPRALPTRLQAALRAAAPPAHSPRPDELWRVAPGALLWVDCVQRGALQGYLVHDATHLASPDELIVRAWDRADGGEDDMVLCLWRRLSVPIEHAQERAGALRPSLREVLLCARRGEGEQVAAGEDGTVWEADSARGLLRWELGVVWGEDDPRERVRAAWSARTVSVEAAPRAASARLLEAARALAAAMERTLIETLGHVIPPLELRDAAVRHHSAAISSAGLVELVLEVGDAQITLCFEERGEERLVVSAQAERRGAPLVGATLTLTSPDHPPLTQTTDRDGLCELSIVPTHERATLEVRVGDVMRIVEL